MSDNGTINVVGCARCGGEHHGLVAYKFQNPVTFSGRTAEDDIVITNWATCPKTHDPILVEYLPGELPARPERIVLS